MNLLSNIINLNNIENFDYFNCASLEKLPCNIYLKDRKGSYINCNDHTAQMAGFKKCNDLLKATDYDLCWSPYANLFQINDEMVIKTETTQVMTEQMRDFKNDSILVTSIKSPARVSKKIIGVVAFSIIQDRSSYYPLNEFNLTKREYACLSYLIKGKTAQQISDILFISKRTVEKHFANIKNKLDCKNKSELIDKVIKHKIINLYNV